MHPRKLGEKRENGERREERDEVSIIIIIFAGGNSGVVYILKLVVGIVRAFVLRCGEACELRRPRDVVWVVVMVFLSA